jgi:hypothetical protein
MNIYTVTLNIASLFVVQPDDGFLIKPKDVAAGPKNMWCVRLLY